MPSDTTETILERLFDDMAVNERFITLGELTSGKEIIWSWVKFCTSGSYLDRLRVQAAGKWWLQTRKQVDFDDFIGCYDLEYELTPRGLKLRKQALECGGHQG